MRGHIRTVAAATFALAAMAAAPADAQLNTDCTVNGGGTINAASGDEATFGGHATSQGVVMGNEVYIDHGPATPVRFQSLTVTGVVCNFDARRAEIVGMGRVDTGLGTQVLPYRIAVVAVPPFAQVPDFYHITFPGYDSGEQPVEHGNITIQGP